MTRHVLGVHDGHNASAAILRDGELLFAVQEERLVGRKNAYGFPREAVRACLDFAGIEPSAVDEVAFATLRQTPERHRAHDQLAIARREAALGRSLRRLLLWYPVFRLHESLGWEERR